MGAEEPVIVVEHRYPARVRWSVAWSVRVSARSCCGPGIHSPAATLEPTETRGIPREAVKMGWWVRKRREGRECPRTRVGRDLARFYLGGLSTLGPWVVEDPWRSKKGRRVLLYPLQTVPRWVVPSWTHHPCPTSESLPIPVSGEKILCRSAAHVIVCVVVLTPYLPLPNIFCLSLRRSKISRFRRPNPYPAPWNQLWNFELSALLIWVSVSSSVKWGSVSTWANAHAWSLEFFFQ